MDSNSLEKKFKSADTNNDGHINFEEFSQMIMDLFHGKTDDEEIKRLFKLMDKDNNNVINLKEFLHGMNPLL